MWPHPSDLTAMLVLQSELRKITIKRKDYSEVLNSELSAIKNKYKEVLVNATELVAALTVAEQKNIRA